MSTFNFIDSLEEKGITLSPLQIGQFKTYYAMLVEWNEKMNLTAITEESEVYLKHFYDSISAGFYYDFNRSVSICDIGAGAGFPSIPLKICFPEIEVTIVDSLNKRITFLDELNKELKLDNVYAYHDRAELFGQNKKHRESYDVVMARAVARMSVLSELCLPLAKVGGQFIVMKGNKFNEELEDGKKAIKLLGGKVNSNHHFSLPIEESDRYISIIDKTSKTPGKFPRKPGTPNKTPIQ